MRLSGLITFRHASKYVKEVERDERMKSTADQGEKLNEKVKKNNLLVSLLAPP